MPDKRERLRSGRQLVRDLRHGLRRAKKNLRQVLEWPLSWRNPSRADLVILDDFFPDLRTAFRIAEFHYLCDRFPGTVIFSTSTKKFYRKFGFFKPVWRRYSEEFPERSGRVFKFNRFHAIDARAAYVIFLSNVIEFLDYLELYRIPFLFTLYPGGAFLLDDEGSDARLRRIFSSEQFAGVIVTQELTRKYLLEKKFCPAERIHFTFGVVVESFLPPSPPVQIVEGQPLNVCFVAFKYMRHGFDKGFDLFVETCKLLQRVPGNFRFHVVGNFDQDDWDISGLEQSLTFHEPMSGTELKAFLAGMQIIIAPNRANTLNQGAFDGFPTGCCVEAALAGVAIFCSDPLGLNWCFEDGRDLVLIGHEPMAIAEKVLEFCSQPSKLNELRCNGQARFAEVYHIDVQMQERVKVIEDLLADHPR